MLQRFITFSFVVDDSVQLIKKGLEIFQRGFSSFDASSIKGSDTGVLLELLAKADRSINALKYTVALCAEECGAHEQEGHRHSGSWVSSKTGDPTGKSISGMDAARKASKHPDLDEAFRNGDLSIERLRVINKVADVSPEDASELLEKSEELTFTEFKDHCEKVRVAALSAEEQQARHDRMKLERYFRTWIDDEGAGRFEGMLPPEEFATLVGAVGHYKDKVFEEARRAGLKEPQQAYAADALVMIAEKAMSGDGHKKSEPIWRGIVSLPSLKKGHVDPGEVCEIPGIGQVPVSVAREQMLGDAIVELVISDGIDVSTIVTNSRYIKKALRSALEVRDGMKCCVPGCGQRALLEYDHYVTDFAKGGLTEEKNLLTLCRWHHRLRTLGLFEISGTPDDLRYEKTAKGTRRSHADRKSDPLIDPDPPPEDRLF